MDGTPDQTLESAELLWASRDGDAHALESLLVRHLTQLRAFVRIRISPLQRACESESDLVQSVCREILEHPDRFEFAGESEFKNWLYGAVLQKCRDRDKFWRAAKRDPQRVDDGSVASLAPAHLLPGSPSRELISAEEIRRIESAYDGLSEEQREVLSLRRWVGLSHSEVGERIGKSESAVKMIQHRALARLSTLLEESSQHRPKPEGPGK